MSIEYIKSRINIDDHYKIFYDIYNNYNNYEFINKEYCKNYLLIIFSELYEKVIDLEIINNMIEKREIIPRTNQQKFRQEVISRFRTCIISDIHYESCQASHIYDLSDEPLNYDVNNGILLNATLHMEFDQLKWGIHPDTYKIIISEKHQCQNLEINKFINIDLQSKLKEYPDMKKYLRKKFEKFINNT
jgi:hypothetical protein